jgi:hypothetical protein
MRSGKEDSSYAERRSCRRGVEDRWFRGGISLRGQTESALGGCVRTSSCALRPRRCALAECRRRLGGLLLACDVDLRLLGLIPPSLDPRELPADRCSRHAHSHAELTAAAPEAAAEAEAAAVAEARADARQREAAVSTRWVSDCPSVKD